jgi:starvation-inducible outer membrane lipoprotein
MTLSHTGLLVASLCLMLLTACSTHPRKVDCESHLTPINTPAPSSKDNHP